MSDDAVHTAGINPAARQTLGAIPMNRRQFFAAGAGKRAAAEAGLSRSVSAGEAEDLLIAISSSGSSPNIVRAIQTAKSMGVRTIAMTGFGISRHRRHMPT